MVISGVALKVKAPPQLDTLRVQATVPQSVSSMKAEKMSVIGVTWVVVKEL